MKRAGPGAGAVTGIVFLAVFFLLAFSSGAFPSEKATVQASVSITGGSLKISGSGGIAFPALEMDGNVHDLRAVSAPTFDIADATGSGSGWNVTLQSADFTAPGGKSIPASRFKFSSGGTVARVTGQPVNSESGPRETAISGAALNLATKALFSDTSSGRGRYTYSPAPENFILTINPDTLSGEYTAVVTATISSGP